MLSPTHLDIIPLVLANSLRAKTGNGIQAAFSATDVNKLACVSKKMHETMNAPHIDTMFWKVNGFSVFGTDFESVCSMCRQAGYSPVHLPNFYRNINIFMSAKYVQELNFSTAIGSDVNYNKTVLVSHDHAKHSITVGRSRENDLCGLLDAGLSRSQGTVTIENGTIKYRNNSDNVESFKKAHNAKHPKSAFQIICQDVRLHMGDIVLIGNASLTTLRVSLGKYDLLRLLDMMQASRSKHGSRAGPGSADEALCTLQLAQMHKEEKTAADFRAMISRIYNKKEQKRSLDYVEKTQTHVASQTRARMNQIQELQTRLVEIKCLQRTRRMQVEARATLNPSHMTDMVKMAPNDLMNHSDESLAQQNEDIIHRLAKMKLLLDEQQQNHTMALAKQAAEFVAETRLRENEKKLENQAIEICVICMDAPRTFAMMPCGHVCCCGSCARAMIGLPCPICRTNVMQVLKTWY